MLDLDSRGNTEIAFARQREWVSKKLWISDSEQQRLA